MQAVKDIVAWRIPAIAGAVLVLIWIVAWQSEWTSRPMSPSYAAPDKPHTPRDKPLVLYTYKETENARQNIDFFIKKGLHDAADFIFILNGETTVRGMIPNRDNIKVVERENKCYDLGAMGEVLRKDDLWKRYKRFITMNASMRGPFFPPHSPGCWSDRFLGRLSNTTKLVGTSVNCQPTPHLQSMLWASDATSMGIMLDPDLAYSVPLEDHYGKAEDPIGLSICHQTMHEAIHTEVGVTRLITSQGYDVDVTMTAYAPSKAAGKTVQQYCEQAQPDDLLYNDHYYGTNIHPYETIFIKANRGISPNTLAVMTEWHSALPGTSYDTCKL